MVSVIVPIYNVKDFLMGCLNSVVNQTLKDIEIVIVDDGSTDGSSLMADEFASKHNNVKVIHKPNGGLMSAWTLGVKESSGEYIGFVDSDDAVDPEMFRKLLDTSIETDADIVMCDDRDSITGVHNTCELEPGLYEGKQMDVIRNHIFPNPGQLIVSNARWNKLYKRHLIIENLKYTICLSRTFEDRYIVPAAIMSAKSFYYLKEPLYIYTQDRPGCNSKKYKENLISDLNRMYNIQKQVLVDKDLYTKYEENWELLYLDCIRVYVGRNIIGVDGFKKRLDSSKALFSSLYFSPRIKKYGRLFEGKIGIAIRLSYLFRSPSLLTIFSYL